MLKNVELIKKYEKEFLEEREEYINFKDESYKNRDYFPGVHYLSEYEKKNISKKKLKELIRQICKEEGNETISSKEETYAISGEKLKIKYDFIREIFIINNLAEIDKLRNYLFDYDLSEKLNEIEIKNGKLDILEYSIKGAYRTISNNLNGEYEIFKLESYLKTSLISDPAVFINTLIILKK